MVLKKCSIQHCISCTTRKEDIGVTYHKYPKDVSLREAWAEVSQIKINDIQPATFICSRHFRKIDFQIYKDSKYVLKSDSIPSIFPWTTMDNDTDSIKADNASTVKDSDICKTETDNSNMETDGDDEHKEIKALNNGKDSEGENLDAIRKYIEEQEKELEELTSQGNEKKNEAAKAVEIKESKSSTEETMDVASSMMDMILSESEARIAKKGIGQLKGFSTSEKGNSMALSVGSEVEAKDFAELWHPAEIMEVDYDEMEVLVHYDNQAKRHDEWISVSSPRLRPRGSVQNDLAESAQTEIAPEQTLKDVTAAKTDSVPEAGKDELKGEDRVKLTFAIGERCLARWRDNKRFMATITKDLGGGKYEIAFDDGFQWKCSVSRLCKYKDNLSVDTVSLAPSTSVPSPIQHEAGPSTTPLPPAYHTHLFDPNRDYLGSKSERREMKRKLNVKELFNIGQKKRKKIPEEKPPKVVTPKKPKVVKKKMTTAADTQKKVLKNDIPEAVASIIGTVNEEVNQDEEEKLEPLAPDSLLATEAKDVQDQNVVEKGIEETPSEIPETEEKVNEVDVPTISQNDMSIAENTLSTVGNDSTTSQNNTLIDENDTPVIKNNESNTEKDASSTEDVTESIKTEDSEIIKIENVDEIPKCIPEEEVKLEKFEAQDEVKHEEVIDKIKEVITKIEDDLNKVEVESPKAEIKEEIKMEDVKEEIKEKSKKLSKIKKGKKLRLLQEKKVKKQVEKVKNELEEMKRQVEEMRKQMMMKTGVVDGEGPPLMPESFLLPGEWCCKWVNGQPVGKVCELESDPREEAKGGLPRRSVQVEDKRLPEGWTKHMVRRSLGHSAGKWDVVLVGPDNRRFHTKTDMRNYLENNPNIEELKKYEHALMDFGVHLKLSRRMGWVTTTPGGTADIPVVTLPVGTLNTTSPLVKRRKLSLKSRPRPVKIKVKEKKRKLVRTKHHGEGHYPSGENLMAAGSTDGEYMVVNTSEPLPAKGPPVEDGYVYVGSLKVQIIDNLLRCPAEGCYKNFRNNTLIKMHIKHYHRELRKMLGRTPKVADLASARALPTDVPPPRGREPELKTIKVKIAKIPKKEESKQEVRLESPVETPTTPVKDVEMPKQDSPKLRNALISKPVKRPKVLLPVRRAEPEFEPIEEMEVDESITEPIQLIDIQDFEAAISTHTVTKPFGFDKCKAISEDDEWYTMSDMETQSSYPRSGSPDSKSMDQKPVSSESNEEQQKDGGMDAYTYTENGERIKIVHMKREEIINCHCGFREEDGLMVQCELCLCWQHALCHNIQKESEVPEKYTCSICLNPRRGRRSKRFLHDQDRLYEGILPGARPCENLRRSHELSGNLLRIQDALHALQVKYHVAVKKDHPKLYLWAKDWENGDINLTQERLNSEYSDLNIMLNSIGKENMRVKADDLNHIDMDYDRLNQRDGLPPVLSGLLSSPGGSRALDLPISTAELERLASGVQEQELPRGPQPEAAIENGPCRERLLRHIQRCQAIIDARLDSIEAQVAELESQDPSFEDDETADYFPRTKQTIQMLMRDLDTMEELGAS